MPASAVPWPLGSVAGSEFGNADQPGPTRPARSGCAPSTPVSRTAIAVEPAGFTEPNAESQPIFGSAHCCVYSGSFGVPAILRTLLVSTRTTFLLPLYFDTMVAAWFAGTETTSTLRFVSAAFSVPPPEFTTDCCARRDIPGFNLRMRFVVAPALVFVVSCAAAGCAGAEAGEVVVVDAGARRVLRAGATVVGVVVVSVCAGVGVVVDAS